MKVTETNINGLLVIEPNIFEDSRGHFFESYNSNEFRKLGILTSFVQDNQSFSHKGVLRGLHFQSPPHQQVKLMKVVNGSIMDVAVDLRKNSKTYGEYYSVMLSNENKTMLYIPSGFAHGFVTLEYNTVVQYKCSNYYNKLSEGCILWDDKDINIDWGVDNPTISDKDKVGLNFKNFKTPF